MKSLKRYFSIIVMIATVATMTACGSKDDKTNKQEETENAQSKTEDTESVTDKETEPEKPAGDSGDSVTEEDVTAVKESIKQAVISEYLEPNGIAPENFTWPESNSSAWEYFGGLLRQYLSKNYLDTDMPLDPNFIPGSPYKEIIDAAYDGIITWYESSGEGSFDRFESLMGALQPWQEVISSISLTE